MEDFDMPVGLTAEGVAAYEAIKKRLNGFKDMDTGGCQSFYSPTEWAERKEEYGLKSVLIVVYDGGDLRMHFNMEAAYDSHCMLVDFLRSEGHTARAKELNAYDSVEKMQDALREVGLYFEECTGWYGAVYKIK